jgi:geranylgeranyl reductase family protein
VYSNDFDTIIIGGGPAGCSAALRLSQIGLKPIIIELKEFPREKVCGGLLTVAAIDFLKDYLNLEIEESIFEIPKELGLFYIPPSGFENGGAVKNYKIINISREKFDYWFSKQIIDNDIALITNQIVNKIWFKEENIFVSTRKGDLYKSRFLIGADGVNSYVRNNIFNEKQKKAPIYQETYDIEQVEFNSIDPYFYNILNGNISNLYSYIIPKSKELILGLGEYNLENNARKLINNMVKFKQFINLEIPNFNNIINRKPKTKKIWFIPFSKPNIGIGNVILVGDAAGLINCFSGEGIRTAIETGFYAAEAISTSINNNKANTHFEYSALIEQIINYSNITRKFACSMNEEKREQYVQQMNLIKNKN